MARRPLAAVAVLVAAGVLTACGSTVPLASTGAAGVAGPSGLGTGPAAGGELGATLGTAPTTSTSSGGGAAVGGAGSATVAPGSAAAPGTTAATGAAAPTTSGQAAPVGNVPGMTAKTVKIGVYTAQGFSSFADSAGFSVDTGDQAAQARAVIAHLNKNGGLAGRTIEPVFHDVNVGTVATDPSTEYQNACARWTQDTRVYAVVSIVGTVNDTLYECLSKAGVPIVTAGESRDASFFERYASTVYQPTDMNLRRILSNNVDALVAAGFYGAAPKIGVILGDGEDKAVDQGLVPALRRHGLTLADRFTIPAGNNASSAYSSAVFRFRSNGITHVMFGYLGSPLLFMINAENQKWYPKYGIHSRHSPAAVLQGNAPAEQQRNAMGIGWQPMNDVDGNHDPGTISARQELCLKLLRSSGQDTSVRATALLGLWGCDNLFFLQDALRRAPDVSIVGLRAGAEALTRYEAASTFRSGFSPARLHDGASAYRLLKYAFDCRCYQYASPLRPAS